jgi:starch phosphorylase
MNLQQNEFPHLPERLKGLGALAGNLWWSWHPEARMLFKVIDRQSWKESGHNPFKMLRNIPADIIQSASQNPDYLRYYDVVYFQFKKYIQTEDNLFSERIPAKEIKSIAYFSAEYGLHRSLPFYAGGLGFLAGDHIKECSDLRIPLVAVGFMYPEGYLLQKIRDDGWQENISQYFERENASISKVLNTDGSQMVVRVPLIEPPIYVGVWKIAVGRVDLYLMDTDIDENDPWNRGISARLYIGDQEQRLRQEIVLGIGGSEVLEHLNIKLSMVHLNEGHAALALLEGIKDRIQSGMNFPEAVDRVKRTTVFTTHTPVPAGHDVFPFFLMEKYFHTYWPALELNRDQFLQMGLHPMDPKAGFNMTAFAMRMSQYRNGVSKRHGQVSRRMWQSLWPDLPEENVPIGHVTNGVHIPTWIEPKLMLLFNKYLGSDWIDDHDSPLLWEMIDKIPDQELWNSHYWLKIKLIDAIRERSRKRWTTDRANPSIFLSGGALLDPSVLTLGFARRFATYKRADLMLFDLNRFKKLLNDRWHPVQIIFSGKAHPADDPGKQILQRIFNTARDPEMGGRIAFVED